MPRYVEVIELNKYMIEWKFIDNIEDVGDQVLTADEFHEQYSGYDWISYGVRYNRAAIRAVLTDVKARIQTEKLKSVVIDDQDLIETLNAVYLNKIDPGFRRKGNQLFLRDTSASDLRKLRLSNVKTLVLIMQRIINSKLNTSFAFYGASFNFPITLEMLKTQVTWDDVIALSDQLKCCDFNMLKSFYDDPSSTADLSRKSRC